MQSVPGSEPVLLGLSFESSESGLAGAELLKGLVRNNQLQGCSAVVVLPPDSYELMQVDLPDLPQDERREAARWQVREVLEFPVEQAVVDVYDVAPFAGDRKPLAHVVAARESSLRDQVGLLADADLALAAIDIPEFALRNLAELFVGDERGTAILYLLEEGGLLTIVRDGVHYLTRYLSSGMSRLIPFAEGDYEALSEQLDAIVLEIQRSFDYCESGYRLPMVSRLLVAQTGQEIPAVTSYLNDYLATRVEPFSFDSVLSVPEGLDQLTLNRHLLAIGGALRREED